MDDLVQFLRARLDEDERAANLMAEFYPAPWDMADRGWMAHVMADRPGYREVIRLEQWAGMPDGKAAPDLGQIIEHVARHDPARILAEVDAKRQIIDSYERAMANRRAHPDDLASAGAFLALHGAVKLLTLPYTDHPEWTPDQA